MAAVSKQNLSVALVASISAFISIFNTSSVSAATVAPSAASASVNCGATKQNSIQGAVNVAAAAVPTTITVYGSCLENIVIPSGKFITLVGASGSSLAPSSAASPVLTINGAVVVLQKMTILGSSMTSNFLIKVDASGLLKMMASSVNTTGSASNSSFVGILAQNNSTLIVSNSSISVSYDAASSNWLAAVAAYNHASITIKGDGGELLNSSSAAASTINAGQYGNSVGVDCGSGSAVAIAAFGNTNSPSVTISRATASDVNLAECAAIINNNTNSVSAITLTNERSLYPTYSPAGLYANDSSIQIRGVTITNNDQGVILDQSQATFLWSSFSNNDLNTLDCGGSPSCDIKVRRGSNASFRFGGNSHLNSLSDWSNLRCTSNGQIYYDTYSQPTASSSINAGGTAPSAGGCFTEMPQN